MGAECLSYVKSIATFALTFFGYIISVLASVYRTALSLTQITFTRPWLCAIFSLFRALSLSNLHFIAKLILHDDENKILLKCTMAIRFMKF